MRVLLVIDYQNDFVTGPLGSDDAVSIEGPVCRLIEDSLSAGDDVIFTMDTHGADYLDTAEGRSLPVEHCIRGTDGWELHGRVRELSMRDGCRILEKDTFGCRELIDILLDYDEVTVCGVATNICVLANAVIARTANPEAKVTVRRDCVASYDRGLGEKALDVLQSLQVVVV